MIDKQISLYKAHTIHFLVHYLASVGVTPRTPLFEGKIPENQKTLLPSERAGYY